MSKHLVKILSICALVVMLAASIVGAAICVSEAIGVTLSIFESGIESEYYEGGNNLAIYIDGVKQDSNKVQVTKYTEVTVEFKDEGYDFVGWYEGEYDLDKDKPTGKSATYKFEVKKNMKLTAVRNAKSYTVTYQGNMDDESPIEGIATTQVYQYNEPLEVLTATDPEKIGFDGWCVAVDGEIINATPVKNATFGDKKEVTVMPAWSNQMVLTLKDRETEETIASTRLTAFALSKYELPGADNTLVANYIMKGYEFAGWSNEQGTLVENAGEFVEEGKTLYLEQTLVEYTINISSNYADTATITYDAVNGFKGEFPVRQYYHVAGVKYNDTVYTYDAEANNFVGLGEALIAGEDLTANVTAVWESDYSTVTFVIAGLDANAEYAIYGDKDGRRTMVEERVMATFTDEEGAGNYDLSYNVLNFFAGYENLRDENDRPVSAIPTDVQIVVTQDGTNKVYDEELGLGSEGNVSFGYILAYMEYVCNIDMNTVTEVTVNFLYA